MLIHRFKTWITFLCFFFVMSITLGSEPIATNIYSHQHNMLLEKYILEDKSFPGFPSPPNNATIFTLFTLLLLTSSGSGIITIGKLRDIPREN